MKSESSGTVTAIFMLIPLVAVPYFAIRGTKDIQGRIPSLSGEDVAFASTDGFEDAGASMDDAPPFPGDDSVVLEHNEPGAQAGWSDPFAGESNRSQGVAGFSDDITNSLNTHRDRHQGGLGGTTVSGGSTAREPTRPQPPTRTVGQTKRSDSTVATQWEDGISKLRSNGMRNYRVESLRDKSMYFVTAFFPGQEGVMRRFEGEGKHPLDALRSVMQQVSEFRSSPPQ